MSYIPPDIKGSSQFVNKPLPKDSEAIKKDSIARCCALNNASAMVTAYATLLASTDGMKFLKEDEIKAWLVAMKHAELKENYKLLGVQEDIGF